MKTTIYLLLFSIIIIGTAHLPPAPKLKKVKTVVIDAGHGGKDPGAVVGTVKEKDIVLAVALKLGKKIKETYPDIEVVYTRETDKFLELSERSELANKKSADLFISLHCNHSSSVTAAGSETFVMGNHMSDNNLEVAKRENSAILLEDNYKEQYEGFDPNSPESSILITLFQNVYLEQSILFASRVEEHLASRKSNNNSRGVKQAGFLVLWRTAMPSVLVELGFLSNAKERAYLVSESGKQELADKLFAAFEQYKKEQDNKK